MKPNDLFTLIKNSTYTKSGDSVDWTVIVDKAEETIRLLFEESNGKRDWRNNFDFPVKIYKNQESCMLVARGWGNAYKSANDEIMERLIATTEIYPYKVEICGWSYGGAMAVLAAEDFYYRTKIKSDVITFGAPKPLFGNKTYKYVLSCCQKVYQYAHVNDCVPIMPPFIGYKMLKKIRVGKDFCIAKLFQPNIYHCIYADETLYQ